RARLDAFDRRCAGPLPTLPRKRGRDSLPTLRRLRGRGGRGRTGGEQYAGPLLRLEEVGDPVNVRTVTVLHMEELGLAAAGEYHVVAIGTGLEAGLDQLGGDIDTERAVP